MKYIRKDKSVIEFITILEDEKNASVFKHFKDKNYKIVTIAIDSENELEVVVYKALYGDYKCYIRNADMFFSEVEKEKYPNVKQKYRFELI
jgi:hypothetical protein